jgi:Fe-S-cluster formation regulator IscX/YfhJ
MSDKKVIDLTQYRKEIATLKDWDPTDLFEEAIDDCVKEYSKHAVVMARDLDIDITTSSFAIYVSTAIAYYRKALRVGLGLEEFDGDQKLADETILEIINSIDDEEK